MTIRRNVEKTTQLTVAQYNENLSNSTSGTIAARVGEIVVDITTDPTNPGVYVANNLGFLNTIAAGSGANLAAGGANTQVQYNNAGQLTGNAAFIFNQQNSNLTVLGNVTAYNFYGNGAYLTGLQGLATMYNEQFVGNGVRTTFTLRSNQYTANTVMVSISGVLQEPINAYTVSGNTLTFTAAPGSGDVIEVREFNIALVTHLENENNTAAITLASNLPVINFTGAAYFDSALETFGDITTSNGYFIGDGGLLTNVVGSYGNANVEALLLNYSNNIVSTGNITAQYFSGAGLAVSDATIYGNLVAVGAVVTGNVSASYFIGNGSQLTGLPASYTNANVANYLPTYTGNLVSLTGNVTTTANISANYFLGNGRFLTGLPQGYSNSDVGNYLVSYTGNIGAGNITVAGNISGNFIAPGGNRQVLYNNQGLISADSGFTYNTVGAVLGVAGNISAGNVIAVGNITGDYILGNGRFLTGLPAGYSNSDVANYLASNANIDITINGNVTANYLTGNITGNITGNGAGYWSGNTSQQDNIISVTHEPTGFPDPERVQSSLAFDNSTRTLYIAPTGSNFSVWVRGQEFVVNSNVSYQVANTTQTNYIYYQANGVIGSSTNYFDFANIAPISIVYWNAAIGNAAYFGDERHGTTMDWQTHEYLHRTRGAAYVTGFVISASTSGTGDDNADAQIGISSGTFYDEDIQVDVTASASPTVNTFQQDLTLPAKIPVFYRSGTGWVRDAATSYPFKFGSARTTYNLNTGGNWTTPDLDNGNYGVMFIVASNNLTYPVLSIMGQGSYNSLGAAEQVDWNELDLSGLPVAELRPLYRICFETSNGYTNAIKTRVRSVLDIRVEVSTQFVDGGTVSAADIAFRETPTTVFANDPTANAAWQSWANTTIAANLAAFTGNIVPGANGVYSLGNVTRQWANLWVAGNTIYLGNVPLGINGSNSLLVNGAAVVTANNTGNINVTGNIITSPGIGTLVLGAATATGSPGLSSTTSLTVTANRTGTARSWVFGNDATLSAPGAITTSGNITTAANVTAAYFIGNIVGNITGNIQVTGSNQQVLFNSDGNIGATSGLVFDYATNAFSVGGNVNAGGALNINSTTGNYNVLNITGATLPAYGGSQTWSFFTNNIAIGGRPSFILFPDGSTQTTAYPGSNIGNVTSLTLSGNATAGNLLIENNAVITGNLRVLGTTTTIDANTLVIGDKDIVVANGATQASDANGAGILVGSTGQYASMIWRSAGNLWDFSGNIAGDVGYFDFLEVVGNITNLGNTNVTGNITGATLTVDNIIVNSFGGITGGTGSPAPSLSGFSSIRALTANLSGNVIVGSNAVVISSNGVIATSGNITSNANVNSAGLTVTGNISVAGNISANNFVGDRIVHTSNTSELLLSEATFRFESNTFAAAATYIEGQETALFLLGGTNGTVVGAGGNTWRFDPRGRLELPGSTANITAVANTVGIFSDKLEYDGLTLATNNFARLTSQQQVQFIAGNGNTSATWTLAPDGSLTVAGNIRGATSYNQPRFISPNSSDTNWAFGSYADGGANYWMQTQFFGLNQPTRGFRVLEAEGNSVVFSVNGQGAATVAGNLTVAGTSSGSNLSATFNISAGGTITSSGNIVSASGNVRGLNLLATGLVSGASLAATNGDVTIGQTTGQQGTITIGDGTASAFMLMVGTGLNTWAGAGSLDFITSSSPGANIAFFPGQSERGRFTSTGLIITGVANVSGNITTPANVSANFLLGNIASANGFANLTTDITTTGNIRSTNNITTGNVTATGNVQATYFIGDGSQLTGLAPALQTYVFANVASDISTYYQMQELSGWTAGTLTTVTKSVTTSPTLLAVFATNTGLPNLTKIPVGSYQVNFETQRTSGAPTVTYYCYAEIYKRSSGGTETLLTTTDSTSTTTSQQVLQQITYKLNPSIVSLLSTDRIVVKIYAVASATSNIDISFDDNTNALFNLPAPAADVATFVPYSGATGLLNMGTYGVTTTANVSANFLLGNIASANGFSNLSSNVTTTGNVSAGNISTGNIRTSQSVIGTGAANTPILDTSIADASYANGATVNFPNFSGMIIVNNTGTTGQVMLVLCGGGSTSVLGFSGTSVPHKTGNITSNGSINGYTWVNDSGATDTFSFAVIRTRTTG